MLLAARLRQFSVVVGMVVNLNSVPFTIVGVAGEEVCQSIFRQRLRLMDADGNEPSLERQLLRAATMMWLRGGAHCCAIETRGTVRSSRLR